MKVNIFSSEWCDLVFENKNKEYGAYESRQLENKRTLIAILTASTLFILIFSFPLLIKAISPTDRKANTEVIKLTDIKLLETKIVKPERIYEEVLPAKLLRKTIIFVPPKIVNTTNDPKELPSQDDLNKNKTPISSTDNPKGNDDPNAPMPGGNTKEEIAPPESTHPVEVYNVEQAPMFPGGNDELINFILRNIQYPELAKTTNITGTVYLKFVIGKDGKIYDITLQRSIGGGCDEEAIKVVSKMPLWLPGKQNGKAVSVRMILPIKFSLK